MSDGRGPSDIELAQIKRLCAKLGATCDNHDHAVVLCAAEIFIASLLVECGVKVAELAEGVGRVAERMQASVSTRSTPLAASWDHPERRAIDMAMELIGRTLARYTFAPMNEAAMQAAVANVLHTAGLEIDREVIAERGRYDILVTALGARIVLELKVSGSAAAVERQAQRYALTDGVDAVIVVTTSSRLGWQLISPGRQRPTLGGKPFAVIALRSF